MSKNYPRLQILLLVALMAGSFYGCTKMDVSVEKQPKDITEQFFKLKGTEPAAVLKVTLIP